MPSSSSTSGSGSSSSSTAELIIDTPVDVTSHLTCLSGKGVIGIIRYYHSLTSSFKDKLTAAEATAITNEGIQIGVVFQNTNNQASYFSYAKGQADGQYAATYAHDTVGQPTESAIYFAVDFDAGSTEITGVITDYFDGVAQGISDAGFPYTIGVYGSGDVCSSLLTAAKVSYTWLAQSTGWSGYGTFTTWDLKQKANSTLCSINIDPNTSHGNWGSFNV